MHVYVYFAVHVSFCNFWGYIKLFQSVEVLILLLFDHLLLAYLLHHPLRCLIFYQSLEVLLLQTHSLQVSFNNVNIGTMYTASITLY